MKKDIAINYFFSRNNITERFISLENHLITSDFIEEPSFIRKEISASEIVTRKNMSL